MGQKFVIHIYIKATKAHRFFGSVAAVCAAYSKEQIGIRPGALSNYFCQTKNAPFENQYCIIYRGILERHFGSAE